ncbi:hypothetical protein D1872_279980 [compost metagenome]
MTQPFSPLYPSGHQPSSAEKCSVPLIAAFIPLVPHASIGMSGLFSQTSTPRTRYFATISP